MKDTKNQTDTKWFLFFERSTIYSYKCNRRNGGFAIWQIGIRSPGGTKKWHSVLATIEPGSIQTEALGPTHAWAVFHRSSSADCLVHMLTQR